jgi:flavin-dependent dehydrogenase
MQDIIVVGARSAGAPTPMLLARKGFKVLLMDRSTFPSDIPHGHFIHKQGPRRLQTWGLLDPVLATGCPPSTTITLDTGEARLVGRDLVLDGVAAGYGPRRDTLHRVLIDGAVAAGAELREGFAVEELISEHDRIVGIRGRDHTGGAPATGRAILSVGADGRGSRLARAVQPPECEVTPTLTCWHFSYWSDVTATGAEVYVMHKPVIFAFPDPMKACSPSSSHGRSNSGGPFRPISNGSSCGSSIWCSISLSAAARRAEGFSGAANLPNFLRRPYGPDWASVGDAGCHKDPYLALGLCDAFRDAEFLVDAIHDGLGEAARSTHRWRNTSGGATKPRWCTIERLWELARFAPSPRRSTTATTPSMGTRRTPTSSSWPRGHDSTRDILQSREFAAHHGESRNYA